MWNTLRDMGFPKHHINLIKNLYENQEVTVRTKFGNTENCKIKKGVRQGCILSPAPFNLYAEGVMRQAGLKDIQEGVRIGGRTIINLRYANDLTLAAGSEEDLKTLIRYVKRASEAAGLHFNIKKTMVMLSADLNTFTLDEEDIEVVHSYIFLGPTWTERPAAGKTCGGGCC